MMERTESSAPTDSLEKKDLGDEAPPTLEKEPSRSRTPELDGRCSDDQLNVQPLEDEVVSTKHLTGVKLYVLFSAVIFSAFLMALNGSIVATAIPQITSHFNSLEDIGWYGSAYLVSTCCLQLLTGKFYTHFPIKQTYITFASIFFVGSLICATAVSSKMLIVGRAIQGFGGAGLVTGAFTTVAAIAPKDKKPFLLGVGMGISYIGSVVGPSIGGALTQHVSWRWCFYINFPPGGLVVFILFRLSIPEQLEKKPVRSNLKAVITEELDLLGFALFTPACVMFLLAMIWGGNQYRWDSATIIGLFCGAFATFVAFVIWDVYRGEKAMIPPKIAGNRLVIFGCCTSCFQMGAMLLLSYYLPLWFQVVKNASPTMSGVMILPTAISQCLGSVAAGRFVQMIGYCTAWALLGSMFTFYRCGIDDHLRSFNRCWPLDWLSDPCWDGSRIGSSDGQRLFKPITAIQNLLPAKDVAIATSQVFFCQYLGSAVFVAIGETIFTNGLRSSLQTYAPNVNAQDIIDAGASAVRSTAPNADLPDILCAYNHAIIQTFYFAVGGSGASFLTSFGMGWQKLPKEDGKKNTENNPA